MVHAGDPASSRANAEAANPTSPQSWLRRIAALVRDGNVAEAESQLRAFRQRYPDAERAVSR
jgi:TolA-binding protein